MAASDPSHVMVDPLKLVPLKLNSSSGGVMWRVEVSRFCFSVDVATLPVRTAR